MHAPPAFTSLSLVLFGSLIFLIFLSLALVVSRFLSPPPLSHSTPSLSHTHCLSHSLPPSLLACLSHSFSLLVTPSHTHTELPLAHSLSLYSLPPCSRSHSRSLSFSLVLSRTRSLCLSRTPPPSQSLMLVPSLTPSLSHTRYSSHSFSHIPLSHSSSLSHTHRLSLSHSSPLSLVVSLLLSLTRCLSHTRCLSYTRDLSHL